MKRAAAMLLTAAMTAALFTGCGQEGATKDGETEGKKGTEENQQDAAGGEDNDSQTGDEGSKAGADNGETYDIAIEMLYFGMEDPDMQEVLDAINEITVPAINATVSFVPTSFAGRIEVNAVG